MTGDLLIELTNWNGYRDVVRNIGRLERCIESLSCCRPSVKSSDNLMLVDHSSDDGSADYLRAIPFGTKFRMDRAIDVPYYDAHILDFIRESGARWIWHIENDSVFFANHDFVGQAMDVLSSDPEVRFVNLRQIGPLDEILQHNARFDHLASAQLKGTPAGTAYWSVDLSKGYSPWSIYSNHGWIAATETVIGLFHEVRTIGGDKPLELQLAELCKAKGYGGARLVRDAFWHWSMTGWWTAPEDSLAVLYSLPDRTKSFSSYDLRKFFYGPFADEPLDSRCGAITRWNKLEKVFSSQGLAGVYETLGML